MVQSSFIEDHLMRQHFGKIIIYICGDAFDQRFRGSRWRRKGLWRFLRHIDLSIRITMHSPFAVRVINLFQVRFHSTLNTFFAPPKKVGISLSKRATDLSISSTITTTRKCLFKLVKARSKMVSRLPLLHYEM